MSKKENKSGSVKKRINYSVGYILLIVAVVVVFVVVNIILEQLPMSLDFTANEQFSITKETEELLDNLRKEGYVRVRINDEMYDLSEDITLDKNIKDKE